jgi:hypothetical protein
MKIIEDFRANVLDGVSAYLTSFTIHIWQHYNLDMREFTHDHDQSDAKGITRTYLDKEFINVSTHISLITHPEMTKVWKNITARIYKNPETDLTHDSQLLKYTRNIQSALSGGSYWEKLPTAQRKNKYEELIKNLNKVADTLHEIDHYELTHGVTNHAERFQLELRLANGSEYAHLFYKIPNLLSIYADVLQKDERYKKNVFIDRPNSNDAPVSYFARSLSTAHERDFGTPLHKTISIIAGIFFPDHDTSYDKIRASIRAMK